MPRRLLLSVLSLSVLSLSVMLLWGARAARAAGSDCKQALMPTEKRICATIERSWPGHDDQGV